MPIAKLSTNILCLLLTLLTARIAVAQEDLSCETLLAVGFDEGFQPQLQLSQSRSLRKPIFRLGKVLASHLINEKSLSERREKYQRILTSYERSKIFFNLIDHPDMIWGRFFNELYGRVYITRHKDQKGDYMGGDLTADYFSNLDHNPELIIEVMKALSRADNNTKYVKYQANAYIGIDYNLDDAEDEEFYQGNWDDRDTQHIIPLISGSLKPFLESDPYGQRMMSNGPGGDAEKYEYLKQAAINNRLPQMREFFDWLYEREERKAYAIDLIFYSLNALNELKFKLYNNRGLRSEVKTLLELIIGVSGEREVTGSMASRDTAKDTSTNQEIIAWLKTLSSGDKRKLRSELTQVFRAIYNTKKELALSTGAFDKTSSAQVVKEINSKYQALSTSGFETQTQFMINKIQDDLMLSAEHADGYRISSTNLESLILKTLADITGIESNVNDFSSRAAAINQHIKSPLFKGSAEEIKAAVEKKASILNSIVSVDDDLQTLKYGVTALNEIVTQALALYDSKMQQMNEVQKSKARHVKDIYDKFKQQSEIKLKAIQLIRDSVEAETQSIDLNLIEVMTKP